jgi:hypothetical protein
MPSQTAGKNALRQLALFQAGIGLKEISLTADLRGYRQIGVGLKPYLRESAVKLNGAILSDTSLHSPPRSGPR